MAPPDLLLLLDHTPTYRQQVLDDLVWPATRSSKVAELPAPHLGIQVWLDMCRPHAGWWKSLLKDVRLSFLALQKEAAAVAAVADPEDVSIASPATRRAASAWCYKCGAAFVNLHALRMHARLAHCYR